jgi:hypothetical protein
MSATPPLALTDDQLSTVLRAAEAIAPARSCRLRPRRWHAWRRDERAATVAPRGLADPSKIARRETVEGEAGTSSHCV